MLPKLNKKFPTSNINGVKLFYSKPINANKNLQLPFYLVTKLRSVILDVSQKITVLKCWINRSD